MQECAIILEAVLKSADGDTPSNTINKTTLAPHIPQFLSNLPNHRNLVAIIWNITQKESRRIFEFQLNKLFIQATEDALSYAFQSGYVKENDGLKNALFNNVEMFLT